MSGDRPSPVVIVGPGTVVTAFREPSVLSDAAVAWSDDRILVANEAQRNVMSVSLLREKKTGDILVFYLRKNNPDDDCLLYLRRSQDELQSLGDQLRDVLNPRLKK